MKVEIFNEKQENPTNPSHPFHRMLVFYPECFESLEAAKACLKNIVVNVFFHGAGERGTNPNDLYYTELPKMLKPNEGNDYDYIFICPQIERNEGWHGSNISRVMDLLLSEYNGAFLYRVTGLSLGGFACYNMIAMYPYFFQTAGILCGNDHQSRNQIPIDSRTHIRAWHGIGDETVSFSSGQDSITRLQNRGYKNECTFVPVETTTKDPHNCWRDVYRDMNLYFDWLKEYDYPMGEIEPPVEPTPPEGSIIVTLEFETDEGLNEIKIGNPDQSFKNDFPDSVSIDESEFIMVKNGKEDQGLKIEVINNGNVDDQIWAFKSAYGKLRLNTDTLENGSIVRISNNV